MIMALSSIRTDSFSGALLTSSKLMSSILPSRCSEPDSPLFNGIPNRLVAVKRAACKTPEASARSISIGNALSFLNSTQRENFACDLSHQTSTEPSRADTETCIFLLVLSGEYNHQLSSLGRCETNSKNVFRSKSISHSSVEKPSNNWRRVVSKEPLVHVNNPH